MISETVVALRKESVDRNRGSVFFIVFNARSLSVRRAWIEMHCVEEVSGDTWVALRKESVDRNLLIYFIIYLLTASLSVRRAWIEINMSCSAVKS